MTIATEILATAHTLGQVRKAAQARCVGSTSARKPPTWAGDECPEAWVEYRFGDNSTIRIEGRKITTSRWVLVVEDVVAPSKRKFVSPTCWACKGTGLEDGRPCTMNDEIPF